MSASDDARAAIAAVLIPDGVHVKPSAAPYVLDVPMPDGRTIAATLDALAEVEAERDVARKGTEDAIGELQYERKMRAENLRALWDAEAERDALRAALTDRDQYQQKATALVEDRWPQGDQSAGEDLARRVLALCEEAGEVARCVLKAGASHSGYRSDTDWVEQMFIEVGQVGFVLATIAEAVGFDHWEAEQAAMADVESKPTAAERARLLLTDRTDGDDGAGIMHGVDW